MLEIMFPLVFAKEYFLDLFKKKRFMLLMMQYTTNRIIYGLHSIHFWFNVIFHKRYDGKSVGLNFLAFPKLPSLRNDELISQ